MDGGLQAHQVHEVLGDLLRDGEQGGVILDIADLLVLLLGLAPVAGRRRVRAMIAGRRGVGAHIAGDRARRQAG